MSVAVQATVSKAPLPLPTYFSLAEQSFSLKKRRHPFTSSSGSNSSCSFPAELSHSLPPLTPTKGCPSLSRVFPQQESPWTPLSNSLSTSPPNSVYDPSKHLSYFNQCFTNLGLVGRGCFGEVYKVQSKKDGRLYAVKRSTHRFRGKNERNRSVREAMNHERICPHSHILDFVAAWEEAGRLYIQTELCSTSLLLHAENKPPGTDEPAAWAYLCDLLSALEHLHSLGFVHLDLKPANVLITDSGRLKLGDFGLLLELNHSNPQSPYLKTKEDFQEGDPRYMAPELLRGEYGPAADVFSLGVSILELACNIEVPNGGEGWQQLRQGHLPSEFANGLSTELQSVLRMMLAPEPSQRPTASDLLSLPSVRKHRWKRRWSLMFAEAMLTLVSLCQSVVYFGYRLLSPFNLPFLPRWTEPTPCTPPRDSWEGDLTLSLTTVHADPCSPQNDSAVFQDTDPELSPTFSRRVTSRLSLESTSTPLSGSPHKHGSVVSTPTHSTIGDWSCNLGLTPSSIHSSNKSPLHGERRRSPSSTKSTRLCGQNWIRADASPRSSLEPKNLLSLFEEITAE
ncbi:membrane-associated tyrosine- and threonine-specific cdc2-inhibitory kinase [Oryzias melastigma]|uniref:non-specific serine/threonine protein kinase n=1 Tax=Oryzias melastigma TaxID=30732 RepID=A0A3B3DZW4_ORYME|nr:membrane-associated tyrosine- and threonine-specific cdc2-inhibitory kinase [Oryzias melastigma]